MRQTEWPCRSLLSGLFVACLMLAAAPALGQFAGSITVIGKMPNDGRDGSPPGGNQGGRPGETSGSPGDHEGGMEPDASPAPRWVTQMLTATTGWKLVETEDRCSENFDLNDRLGANLNARFGENEGGTNTKRPDHKGVDVQGDTGDRIKTWKGGFLSEYSRWDGRPARGDNPTTTPCGHAVTVAHADGSKTTCCHLAVLPRTSGWISAGDVVGLVGSTGRSTGPHAHIVHQLGSDKYVEYFDYTKDRPTESQLDPNGC